MIKIKWSWQRCGNLIMAIYGFFAIALLAFVLISELWQWLN